MANSQDILDVLKKIILMFIREGTLVPAVHQLLHLHTEDISLHTDENAALLKQLWKDIDLLDSPHFLFPLALQQCFAEYGSEIGEKIIQEIDSRRNEIPPGVVYYIALGLLESLKDKPSSNNEAYTQILKKAVIDIVQCPLGHVALYAGNCSSLLPFDAADLLSWGFINDAVQKLDKLSINSLKNLVLSLLSKVELIESDKYDHTREIKVMEEYLSAHPRAINDLVNDGFRKHEKLISRLDGIPILWHLSFLDQWIHEGRFVLKTLPERMRLFSRDRIYQLHHFINFCIGDKKRFEYFRLLSNRHLGYFISLMFDNYDEKSLDTRFTTSNIKLVRFMRKLSRKKVVGDSLVQDDSKLSLETMHEIFEVIDPERLRFLKIESNDFEDFVESLWRNNFSDYFYNPFYDIHNEIGLKLDSNSSRRMAYLVSLLKILKIKRQEDFLRVLNLMQRRFDIDKYHCSDEDLAFILHKMLSMNIHRLIGIYKTSDNKHKILFEHLISAFIDLFSEVYYAFDLEERIEIIRELYGRIKPLSSTLSSTITSGIKKIGIRLPIFDNDQVMIISTTPSIGEDSLPRKNAIPVNTGVTPVSSIPDWYLRAKREWETIVEKGKYSMGEIPVIFHPFYGYGVFFTRFGGDKVDKDEKLVVMLLNDTFSGKINHRFENEFIYMKNIVALKDDSETKKQVIEDFLKSRLEGTFLENAALCFVKAEAFPDLTTYYKEVFLHGETFAEYALNSVRQREIRYLAM